ncbi:MAG TPA: hypothetical protein VIW78_01700 [Burkholderiales bacterium]
MFGLLRDKELEAFAADLARQFGTRMPPSALTADRASDPKFKATLAAALHHVFLAAQNYCRGHKVGLLKRARFSKTFQDEIKSLGYPDDFVREVTMSLAEQLTQI